MGTITLFIAVTLMVFGIMSVIGKLTKIAYDQTWKHLKTSFWVEIFMISIGLTGIIYYCNI